MSPSSNTTTSLPSLQKALLALSLATALLLLCALARRRLEASRARTSFLVEVLANVSEGLDRLEAGLDDIAARTAAAKTKLGQLAVVQRQNLVACAILRERRQRGRSSNPVDLA